MTSIVKKSRQTYSGNFVNPSKGFPFEVVELGCNKNNLF